MRILFILCAFMAASLTPSPAMAQEKSQRGQDEKIPTRIVTDSENGEIHFYINGELSAILKDNGLHVREDIHFGGMIIDNSEEFDFLEGQPAKDKNDAR